IAVAAVIAAVLVAGAALAGAQHRVAAPPSTFTATFLDVGQGDATLFQAPGAIVLVDGGPPESDVVAKLRARGVSSLDVVVLTHAPRDQGGGVEAVVRALPVGLRIDGGAGSKEPRHARIVAAARARGDRVTAAVAGESLTLGGLRLRVLSPPAG